MLLTLNLRPGRALGPFFLGMPIGKAVSHIQDTRSEHHIVEIKYSQSPEEAAVCKDIILNFPEAGMHLRFEPHSQRLRLIEVYDLTRMQVRYGQSLVGGASNAATFVRIYDLFGPTFPGELDARSARYTLHYPGLSFVFPLQRQHAAQLKEAELPLEFPDGTTPVATRVCIYTGSISKLQSMEAVQPPPIQPGTHYFEKVEVSLEKGITFGSTRRTLLFGASPQDVWSLLGCPSSSCSKASDTMAIHSGQGGPPLFTAGTDYFYNYFSRGMDILFCGKTHRVKKFVLHTNPPGHLEFNVYTKCNFEILVNGLPGVEMSSPAPPCANSDTQADGDAGTKQRVSVAGKQEAEERWRHGRAPSSQGIPLVGSGSSLASTDSGDTSGAESESTRVGQVEKVKKAKKKAKKNGRQDGALGPPPASCPLAGKDPIGIGEQGEDQPKLPKVWEQKSPAAPPCASGESLPAAHHDSKSLELPPMGSREGSAPPPVLTSASTWEEAQAALGPGGRATIHTGGCASNPFGPTFVYGYRGIVLEVMKNGQLASVTLFKP